MRQGARDLLPRRRAVLPQGPEDQEESGDEGGVDEDLLLVHGVPRAGFGGGWLTCVGSTHEACHGKSTKEPYNIAEISEIVNNLIQYVKCLFRQLFLMPKP